ncbi:MAG: 50S ribosomal protein L25 [Planctomycetes bacterium]|nr:50S ribosomal protein L25 [Planctomycetota bacterium]MCG2685415.1 50S ribosomal protein L25 [Planctomycetales bacterium]
MALQLAVEPRHTRGKRNNLRLRRAGKIPAILYGHGLECVPLSVEADTLAAAIRHGSRLVSLTGAVDESAFVRDLQWDTWGTHIIHVDFTRISEHEIVEIRLPIELRGESPGVREGGVVSQLVHEVEIACPASAIPEKLVVNINHLKLNDSVSLGDLELPQGAKLLASDLEMVAVECVVPQEQPEEEAAEAAPGEPEIIGEKEKEEDGAKE